MGKRPRFRDCVDPEYQRWGRTYPRFPGVAECVRLIRAGKARGAWADQIVYELAENTADCLPKLIAAFRERTADDVAIYVMMALEIAELPAAVPFLTEVVRAGDDRYAPYARRTLEAIGTREARSALWNAEHP